MHSDYLEIKKNFLSHSKPYKEGTKKYNRSQKILNTGTGGTRTLKDEYKQLLSLARMWQSGKKSMDELANSMGQTEFRAISAYDKTDVGPGMNEERIVRTTGLTNADLNVIRDFIDAYRYDYKGPARHSALSHASSAGMPTDVRKKGPVFSKFYNSVDKAPSDIKWKAAASNALSGYANDLNKKMQTMVNSGKQAVAQYNSALANAKQSNAASARFMDSLNSYNNIVRQARSIGNSAKFKSATVKWRDINGALAIYYCTLQDTDTDPGNQSW